MVKFGEIERVVFSQFNPVLLLPPITSPLTSPFPIELPNAGTINLALVNIRSEHDRDGVLLSAVVNWSATFTPPTPTAVLNVPGFADVTFELLRNGVVIYRVDQTAVQKGVPLVQPTFPFTTVSTFEIASLLHFDFRLPGFDFTPPLCLQEFNVYTLRATNIALVPPQVATGTATTTAAVGAATLVAEKVEAHRSDPADAACKTSD
ncbi:MAG: hypothetical protein P4N41_07575 [Negativicutes bacterium]|nr:hypothetical protein [Negativicutes bacterium]